MKVLKLFGIAVASLLISSSAFSELSAHLSLGGSSTQMVAGKATNLSLHIYDMANPDPLHHFHPMHGKVAHLVIVRDDLSSFAHVHPTQTDMHHPMFGIKLNAANSDPDNQDAATAVPLQGRYMLFTELMPMGYSMTTLPQDIVATGPESPTQPFVLDPVGDDGVIRKNVKDYQFSLKAETYPECGSFSVLLRVLIERRDQNDKLVPVTDLEPWLESYGHAILISRAGTTAAAKTFSHLHGVWPLPDDPSGPRGPDLEMTSDNHAPMQEGDYKVWVQTKHAGQILTVPFTLNIVKPAVVGKC